MANKKTDASKQVNPRAGLDQMDEKASLAEEGPNGDTGNKAGVLPGQKISEESPSPLADSIEAEKLAQYEKSKEEANS